LKEYRPPRRSLWGCLLFAVGWLAVGTWTVFVQLENIDGQFPHPIGGALFMGGMTFIIAGMGV
jgi:hypothetical protein